MDSRPPLLGAGTARLEARVASVAATVTFRAVGCCSTSATMWLMENVGLRELRQDASDLVRRAQGGEEITITVSGRPSARLVPAGPTQWRRWNEIAELFHGPADSDWDEDRRLLDDDLRDPWVAR